jgi:hypothetical protein
MTYSFFSVLNLQKFVKALKEYTCQTISSDVILRYLMQADLSSLRIYAHDTGDEFSNVRYDFQTEGIRTVLKRAASGNFVGMAPSVRHSASVVDDTGLVRHVKPVAQLGLLKLPSLLATHSIGLMSHDGFTEGKLYPLSWEVSQGNSTTTAGCAFIELSLPEKVPQLPGYKGAPDYIYKLKAIPLSEAIIASGVVKELDNVDYTTPVKPIDVPICEEVRADSADPVDLALKAVLGDFEGGYQVMPRVVVAVLPVATAKGVAWLMMRPKKASSSIRAYSLPKQVQMPGTTMAGTAIASIRAAVGEKVFAFLDFIGVSLPDNWIFKNELLLENGVVSVNVLHSAFTLSEKQFLKLTTLAREDKSAQYTFEALDITNNTTSYQWKHAWERQLSI